MATLERAIEIAAKAHAGQVDKAGQPYILHPIQVMLRVTGTETRIAAILHDVIEDSEFTIEDLRKEGFSNVVLLAVAALTKRENESRIDAALRASENEIARIVKLADNAENMDLSRIANPTDKDYARLKEYEKVREILIGSSNA
ncbi:HD domain-containing protein [Rheinheimera sp. EpRS3]|uniref:HD domain-containing protein n=1 Tax=Rheinheimera sp. EpRS3 TaxID=1712383 RepID=UPI00074A9ACE|nr:HD domain-containing protein [Rheinheimera sp. EpRS3]KUM51768.1 guanosine-3',5'-bis(diphosphate) 3'-pyrophosphohydrolase [Rheinheimera sp. EpRS3]